MGAKTERRAIMSINVGGGELRELKPRILVIGVGGAGGNAINAMIEAGMQGVEFVAVNTDAQDLKMSKADAKIQIGMNLTKGLGAGAKQDIGQAAADESINEIVNYIQGSNMVFIASGMGGGTGTGASHVIARAAREMNILTVGVTTLPFSYEGPKRMRRAIAGLEELKKYLDTTIVVPNQNLFKIANESTGFEESFSLSNDVLKHGVQSITDLMVRPGMINLDFADVETVMTSSGKAMMGTGEAEGQNRAIEATDLALNNPLIDEYSLQGAKGLLVNITGGSDIKLFEVDAAVNKIRAEVDPEAELIFGAIKDENMNGKIRVSIVATALNGSEVKPYLNLVNTKSNVGHSNKVYTSSDGLFNSNFVEKNISNSIEGATALKLDESFEIKNSQEQSNLIDRFEKSEENEIAEGLKTKNIEPNEFPAGISIESTSYMENKADVKMENQPSINSDQDNAETEYTPKLFSDESIEEEKENNSIGEPADSKELFDHDNNEDEDFEIPAFLRRQKF